MNEDAIKVAKYARIISKEQEIEFSDAVQILKVIELQKLNDNLDGIDTSLHNIYNEFPR